MLLWWLLVAAVDFVRLSDDASAGRRRPGTLMLPRLRKGRYAFRICWLLLMSWVYGLRKNWCRSSYRCTCRIRWSGVHGSPTNRLQVFSAVASGVEVLLVVHLLLSYLQSELWYLGIQLRELIWSNQARLAAFELLSTREVVNWCIVAS